MQKISRKDEPSNCSYDVLDPDCANSPAAEQTPNTIRKSYSLENLQSTVRLCVEQPCALVSENEDSGGGRCFEEQANS